MIYDFQAADDATERRKISLVVRLGSTAQRVARPAGVEARGRPAQIVRKTCGNEYPILFVELFCRWEAESPTPAGEGGQARRWENLDAFSPGVLGTGLSACRKVPFLECSRLTKGS